MTSEQIILKALDLYKPVKVALMFSGGHDSLVNSHVSASILESIGVPFVVYHGDTTIGIPETQRFVKDVCKRYGWELVIKRPPNEEDWYENIIRKYGFPGPGKNSHKIMYIRLKERAICHWVTHEVKSKPHARENVLLLSGARKSESVIRMGYTEEITKTRSRVWANPVFYWTKKDIEKRINDFNLPRNPVKDKICISGECLCGCFTSHEERMEINAAYPETGKRLDELESIAIENGHPWPWSQGPTKWYKNHPPGQTDMFMCQGCEVKYQNSL